ncbi:MAG: malonate transporter subunit MadL [Selenomonadaceae bacterium]
MIKNCTKAVVYMAIYGVALLAGCMFAGVFLGNVLGVLIGVKANVGGVGFAMLFLIILTNRGMDKGWLNEKSQSGISFWSAMYIPIVVAMSSIQDVIAALSSGPLAILSGFFGTAIAFVFVPVLVKMGSKSKVVN